MDILHAILDAVVIVAAHTTAGLFAAPLKYKKWVSVPIWCVWGTLQTLLLVYILFADATIELNFIIGFVSPYVGQYVLFFILTKGKFAKRLFTILTYSVFFCIYMGIASSVIGSLSPLHWGITSLLRTSFLFAIVLLFLKKISPMFWNTLADPVKNWWLLVFANAVFLLAIVSSSVFPNKLESVRDPYFIAFLTLVIAIVSVYPILFVSIKSMAELAREKQRKIHTELLQAQVEAQATEASLARQYRHDLRHHYQMLLSLSQDGETDKIIAYLNQQAAHIERMGSARFCENDTINNILKFYHQKAKKLHIDCTFSAGVKSTTSIPDPELVIIVANILENALHGATASGSNAPFITASVKHRAERLVISCENACDPSLCFDEIPDTLCGIGIHSIVSTVDRLGGTCRFFAKDGAFKCIVILNDE